MSEGIGTGVLMKKITCCLVLACIIFVSFSGTVSAENLLNRAFVDAARHDFVDHFDFKESAVHQIPETGLTEHIFFSTSCGGVLEVGVSEGRIVHLRLRIPRQLIDDPSATVLGRDLMKSFIESLATTDNDWNKLKALSDEVWVRGLELHPISIGKNKTFRDTGKSVPETGYKVGAGPYKQGQPVIFIEKLPNLNGGPSELFLAVMGKKESAFDIMKNCRMSVVSFKGRDGKVPSVCCDAWDENYWQKHLEPRQRTN